MHNSKTGNKRVLKYFIIFVLLIMINVFYFCILTPIKVDGVSMEPTINDNDIIFINRIYTEISKDDIIVFYYNGYKLVKRVIGIEGDVVEINNSKLYINNEMKYELEYNIYSDKIYFVNLNEYFVIGDNLKNSYDSRDFGKITKEDIIGQIST